MTRTSLAASALVVAITLTIPPLADVAAQGSGQPAAAVRVFTNVNVVPMDRERLLERQVVIVSHGVIERVGPAGATTIPAGAVVVDGTGKWLMPGLAEMHAHVPGGQATDEALQRVLELFVLNGVTTARGMLGDPRHLPLRGRTHRGEILAPWLVTSGPSFNGNSAPTIDVATKMVDDQKAAGYDS